MSAAAEYFLPNEAAVTGGGALAACAVSFSTGRKLLLDGVSARIEPGKILAVIGPNGAGKTTLLRLLAGELAPAAGNVQLAGRALADCPRAARARRVAVLPQQSTLSAALTGLEVTLLGRAPHAARSSADLDLSIAHAALASVDAAHLAWRFYPSLSGGEKSRVQTARVLAQIWGQSLGNGQSESSRFLLLDEPTAALDCAHQHRLLACARQCARNNVGVFAVLHDLNLAAQYADQILVLASGRAAACGPPEEIFQPDLLSEVFGMEMLVFPHPQHGWPLVVPAVRGL